MSKYVNYDRLKLLNTFIVQFIFVIVNNSPFTQLVSHSILLSEVECSHFFSTHGDTADHYICTLFQEALCRLLPEKGVMTMFLWALLQRDAGRERKG